MNIWKKLETMLIFLIMAVVCTVLMVLSNANPLEAYQMFFYGLFGNINGFAELFVKATPLIFTGLALTVAFKTNFFNIGAEGQFYMGAVGAAIVALYTSGTGLSGVTRILMAMTFGFFLGGIWAFVAAFLKSEFGISEIIVTIMQNYIAVNITGMLVRGPLQNTGNYMPQTAKFDPAMALPEILPPSRLHVGFLLAILATILVWIVIQRSILGYELRVVGLNGRAAHCNGISVGKSVAISAFLSGGLAGLAGVVEVLGIQHRLLEGISSEVGYTAILIALLANTHPLGVAVAATGFAALQVGANTMQRQLGIPAAIVSILIGLTVLLILSREAWSGWVGLRSRTKGGEV
jgi:simple sugar transport system permease protein